MPVLVSRLDPGIVLSFDRACLVSEEEFLLVLCSIPKDVVDRECEFVRHDAVSDQSTSAALVSLKMAFETAAGPRRYGRNRNARFRHPGESPRNSFLRL